MIQKKLKMLMAKSIELEYVENCRNEINEYEYSKIFEKDNLSIWKFGINIFTCLFFQTRRSEHSV